MILTFLRKIKAALKYILKYFYGFSHDLFGEFRCCVCNKKVLYYIPLERFYFKKHKLHNYKMGIQETCNIGQYKCPRCGAVDRDRLSALYIQKHLISAVKDNEIFNILKFGPNPTLTKFMQKVLSNLGNYNIRTADFLKDNVNDKVDITDMHIYKNNQFDFFLCSHILEHVSDDHKAFSELIRVLKHGGKGILMRLSHLLHRKLLSANRL